MKKVSFISAFIALSALLLIVSTTGCKKDKTDPPPIIDPVESVTTTKVYTQNGLILTFINNDPHFDTLTRQKMVNTFFQVYPAIMERFNPQAIKTVVFRINTGYADVAYASNGEVVYGAAYMKNNPMDIDVVTHEVTHLIQAYTGTDLPGWLIEGIADYSRNKYGLNNAASGWVLPDFASSQAYTDSYGVTARFLTWLENRLGPTLIEGIDARLRNNTYNSNSWVDLTGKTIDELWSNYAANPAL